MGLNTFTATHTRNTGATFKVTLDFSNDLDVGEAIRSIGGPSQTRAFAVDETGASATAIIKTTTIASQTIVLLIALTTVEHTYHIVCFAEGVTSGLVEPQIVRVAARALQPF